MFGRLQKSRRKEHGENHYPHTRRVVPGPIDPSREEKKFHLRLAARAESHESFLFLCLRARTLFIHDLPSTHWSRLGTRNWFPTNSLVECAQFWNDTISVIKLINSLTNCLFFLYYTHNMINMIGNIVNYD